MATFCSHWSAATFAQTINIHMCTQLRHQFQHSGSVPFELLHVSNSIFQFHVHVSNEQRMTQEVKSKHRQDTTRQLQWACHHVYSSLFRVSIESSKMCLNLKFTASVHAHSNTKHRFRVTISAPLRVPCSAPSIKIKTKEH